MVGGAQYSTMQKVLHWTTVAFVIVLVPLGFYMVWRYDVTDNDRMTVLLFDWHKLAGLLLLVLVLLRLGVRLVKGVPPAPAELAPPQRMAAATVHGLLYILLLAIPVIGWAGASAYGLLSLPGGLHLPAIMGKNDDLAGRIFEWHGRGAIALSLLAGAHVGAALLHKLYFKDGIFERMWPGRNRAGDE